MTSSKITFLSTTEEISEQPYELLISQFYLLDLWLQYMGSDKLKWIGENYDHGRFQTILNL